MASHRHTHANSPLPPKLSSITTSGGTTTNNSSATADDFNPSLPLFRRSNRPPCRLAAILHIAEQHSPNQPIDQDAIGRAIGLADWWLEEALRYVSFVHDQAPDSDMIAARKAVDWLRDRGEATFMLSDLNSSGMFRRSHGNTVRDLHGIVETLEAHHWVVPEHPEWVSRRGCRFMFNNDRNVMKNSEDQSPDDAEHALHAQFL